MACSDGRKCVSAQYRSRELCSDLGELGQVLGEPQGLGVAWELERGTGPAWGGMVQGRGPLPRT